MKQGGRWSEMLNHPSVSAEGEKSRPEREVEGCRGWGC